MKTTKGHEPSSKSGGMQSHLGSSPGNNPTASKSPGLAFAGNAGKHMKTEEGAGQRLFDGNKSRPPCRPTGTG